MTELLTDQVAILTAVCIAAAGVAIAVLTPRRQRSAGHAPPPEPRGPILLFRGSELTDASADVDTMFDTSLSPFCWETLHTALRDTYPALPASPDVLGDHSRTLISASPGLEIGDMVLERFGDTVRVQLSADSLDPAPSRQGDGTELETLRLAMDATPYPVWRQDAAGTVVWHNTAYATLARKSRGAATDLSQPLFSTDAKTVSPGRRTRVSVSAGKGPDGQCRQLWFDVTMVRQNAGDLFFANDVNAVVDAEIAQRNFVQTLAKTFAQLSIGLAIFDRNRQLALFNPALIDLTSLPVDFLSSRPTLFSFFDRLRDQKMMPEPRDYRSWRQQMAELDAAARNGNYQETWSLPSGSVYSVSGRPHPDGAVALLFEDITAEVTLTRRFRSELELGQAVLDRMEDAIAVFSADGVLAFSNTSFNALWDVDPDRSFAQVTILEAARTWQDRSAPTPVWGEIRDFVAQRDNRAEWWADILLRDGSALACAVHPIQNGATMVRFSRPATSPDKPIRALPGPARDPRQETEAQRA